MLPVFTDPNKDAVFKRIFGSEARKPQPDELKGPHRIRNAQRFSPEHRVTARNMFADRV